MLVVRSIFTRFRLKVDFGLNAQHMREVGNLAIKSIRDRLAHGLGIDDQRLPRLSLPYERFKQRRTGRSLRDLRFTGAMLANLSVRSADNRQVTIDLTSGRERIKALRNQRIAPWLGLSPGDRTKIDIQIRQLVDQKLKSRARAA